MLHREDPVGATIIIGGTNVRFCLSHPASREPLSAVVKWQDLNEKLAPELEKTGTPFSLARDLVFQNLAKTFIAFFANTYGLAEKFQGSAPFDKISSFNFSIAGPVTGNGIAATVTTTNTRLQFSTEPVAQTMLAAVKAEIARVGGTTLNPKHISVWNDAEAALWGEVLSAGLDPSGNYLLVIFGTGVGSASCSNGAIVKRFAELGHRVLFNLRTGGSELIGSKEFSSKYMAADGSFRDLGRAQRYAENQLAGPWVAIRFVKEHEEKPTLFAIIDALERKIEEKISASKDAVEQTVWRARLSQVESEIDKLAQLSLDHRTRWAAQSPEWVIRLVNETIMNPEPIKFFETAPCDDNMEQLTKVDPESALVQYIGRYWKKYWKDVGEFLGQAYGSMQKHKVTPSKIFLAGGIAEHANRLDPFLRGLALGLIHKHGKLARGTVDFSTISAEQRECMQTYQETMAELKDRG